MGLPSIAIAFKSTAASAIKRGERGIVALILKDSAALGIHKMVTIADVPSELSAANQEQIKLAMMGTVNPPNRILAYVIDAATTDYSDTLNYMETLKFDYLAFPEIELAKIADIATWVKQMRDTNGRKIKVVLPNHPADHEGILNFASDNIVTELKTYSTAEYCSRMAGICAGLPLTVSPTFQALPEVLDCDRMTKDELNIAIDAGKLVLMNDGEKVKIARGVNSLVSTTPEKGTDYQKITVVDKLDLAYTDIKKTAEDYYIGKYTNSYDHKVLLISAIQGYFEILELNGIYDKGKSAIYINFEAQRAYLKSIGVDVDSMSDQEIKEANTKDKVFLAGAAKPLDAMEDISLDIGI